MLEKIEIGDIKRIRTDGKKPKDKFDYHIFEFPIIVFYSDNRKASVRVALTSEELGKCNSFNLLKVIHHKIKNAFKFF